MNCVVAAKPVPMAPMSRSGVTMALTMRGFSRRKTFISRSQSAYIACPSWPIGQGRRGRPMKVAGPRPPWPGSAVRVEPDGEAPLERRDVRRVVLHVDRRAVVAHGHGPGGGPRNRRSVLVDRSRGGHVDPAVRRRGADVLLDAQGRAVRVDAARRVVV